MHREEPVCFIITHWIRVRVRVFADGIWYMAVC